MSEAIITGLVAIAVCLINNFFQQRAVTKQHNETIAVFNVKIDALQKTVEKHNQLIDRTYRLEESTALQDAELKRINERLKIVEGGKAS